MGCFLKADLKVKSVHDIDLELLKKRGIKGFFFDIDNTLEEYATPVPSEETLAFFRKLDSLGFKIGLVSNAKSPRVEKFIKAFPSDFPEVFYFAEAGKPLKKAYRLMSCQMKLKCDETVMVGDQLFTDILGGNRAKCFTVLVEPINPEIEPGFVRFKRKLEKPFM